MSCAHVVLSSQVHVEFFQSMTFFAQIYPDWRRDLVLPCSSRHLRPTGLCSRYRERKQWGCYRSWCETGVCERKIKMHIISREVFFFVVDWIGISRELLSKKNLYVTDVFLMDCWRGGGFDYVSVSFFIALCFSRATNCISGCFFFWILVWLHWLRFPFLLDHSFLCFSISYHELYQAVNPWISNLTQTIDASHLCIHVTTHKRSILLVHTC